MLSCVQQYAQISGLAAWTAGESGGPHASGRAATCSSACWCVVLRRYEEELVLKARAAAGNKELLKGWCTAAAGQTVAQEVCA